VDPEERALLDHVAEVFALEALHHDVGATILERANVENASDVLASKADGGTRLAHKTTDDVSVPKRYLAEELDGDVGVEAFVLGSEHDPHAALTDDALDPILSSEELAPAEVWLGAVVHIALVGTVLALERPGKRITGQTWYVELVSFGLS
jgi:hypothetical protein